MDGENLALYGIPLNKIYTDFLSYLLAQTRRHLRDSTGSDPWPEMAERAEIVLSHPNRWGESQQKFLQNAAIAAGLVSGEGAAERLVFIEEGEASASFCMSTNVTMASRLTVSGLSTIICRNRANAISESLVLSSSSATQAGRLPIYQPTKSKKLLRVLCTSKN